MATNRLYTHKGDKFSRFQIKRLVKNDFLQRDFSRHRQMILTKKLISEKFSVEGCSVYQNRLSGFDGLFSLHKLSSKNRYLQHITTGFAGINLAIGQAATATQLKLITREVFCCYLFSNWYDNKYTKHFIIKKRNEEVKLSSTSTNARNLSRHFRVSSFLFKSRLDVKFCPVKYN